MHTVALEMAAYNITVNAIAPGYSLRSRRRACAETGGARSVRKMIPMHRVGFPDDAKGLALFLASPASDYVTGQEIVIDGGLGLGTID